MCWRRRRDIWRSIRRSPCTPRTFAMEIFPQAHFHTSFTQRPKPAPSSTTNPRWLCSTPSPKERDRALQFSIASSVSRFLLVSSGAVYGTQPAQVSHINESFNGAPDTLNPASAYGEGKRSAEMLCTLASSPRLNITIARCFAFVGPYMQLDAHFAIGNFISDAVQGRPFWLKGMALRCGRISTRPISPFGSGRCSLKDNRSAPTTSVPKMP